MNQIFDRAVMYYRSYGLRGIAKRVLANPGAVVGGFTGPRDFYHLELSVYREDAVTFLRPLVSCDDETIVATWQEITGDIRFRDEIEARLAATDERPATLHSNWRELLYTLVRLQKPEIVVETGVFDGLGSAYILAALQKNDSGRLVSIDVGENVDMPADVPECEVGWIVPDRLQDRWDCKIGDARELLPEVAASESSIGIFLHDSLHTYDHMRFEYETALSAMEADGVLVSDNVRFTDAFAEIADERLRNDVYWKNTEYAIREQDRVDDRLGAGLVRTESV